MVICASCFTWKCAIFIVFKSIININPCWYWWNCKSYFEIIYCRRYAYIASNVSKSLERSCCFTRLIGGFISVWSLINYSVFALSIHIRVNHVSSGTFWRSCVAIKEFLLRKTRDSYVWVFYPKSALYCKVSSKSVAGAASKLISNWGNLVVDSPIFWSWLKLTSIFTKISRCALFPWWCRSEGENLLKFRFRPIWKLIDSKICLACELLI